ncbi:MAG: anti-sigma regulatory factor [Coleofasciculus sp. G1-WW12-02]|uniref:ATP-binding protein n=1 Tax=unclassified Coleofasciculus TaxID=2692782 RepID=UPI0033054DDF
MKGFEQLIELQTFSNQFPSDLNALDQVLSWFGELHPSSIETKLWLQCKLALAEGYTNAVKYAHKDLPSSVSIDVEVVLAKSPQRLEIRIWDCGAPFDFERRLQNPSSLPDDQAEGGRGLAIMQRIADKLSYTRMEDNRNCLTIVKFY